MNRSEHDPLHLKDFERKGKQGVLAGGIYVRAPELPAKEGAAHLHTLLGGFEGIQGGGAQEGPRPLVRHGEGQAGRVLNPGRKQS